MATTLNLLHRRESPAREVVISQRFTLLGSFAKYCYISLSRSNEMYFSLHVSRIFNTRNTHFISNSFRRSFLSFSFCYNYCMLRGVLKSAIKKIFLDECNLLCASVLLTNFYLKFNLDARLRSMTLLLIAPSCVATNGTPVFFWILIFADSCERVNVGRKNSVSQRPFHALLTAISHAFLSFFPFLLFRLSLFVQALSLRKLSFHIVYNSQAHLSTALSTTARRRDTTSTMLSR